MMVHYVITCPHNLARVSTCISMSIYSTADDGALRPNLSTQPSTCFLATSKKELSGRNVKREQYIDSHFNGNGLYNMDKDHTSQISYSMNVNSQVMIFIVVQREVITLFVKGYTVVKRFKPVMSHRLCHTIL